MGPEPAISGRGTCGCWKPEIIRLNTHHLTQKLTTIRINMCGSAGRLVQVGGEFVHKSGKLWGHNLVERLCNRIKPLAMKAHCHGGHSRTKLLGGL